MGLFSLTIVSLNLTKIAANFLPLWTRVLSEPHSLLDALYLHNRNVLDDVAYRTLVKSIMKVHIACATTKEDIKTLVFKPVFKCTPQIKLMVDG